MASVSSTKLATAMKRLSTEALKVDARPGFVRDGGRDPVSRPAAPQGPVLTPEIISGATQVIDFISIVITAGGTFLLYIVGMFGTPRQPDRYVLTALLGAALFFIVFRRLGGYRFGRLSMLRWQLARVAGAWLGVAAALVIVAFFTKVSANYSRGWALSWTVSSLAVLLVERAILYGGIHRWSRRGYLTRNIVVVGAGEQGERLIERLRVDTAENITIIGVFDDRRTRIAPVVAGCPVLGTTDDLLLFARQVQIDEVIVALPLAADQRFKVLIDKLRSLPVDLRLSVEPLSQALPVRGMSFTAGVPVLDIVERPLKQWNAVIKSIEDKVIGGVLAILSAPLMAIIAVAIKLDSGGPVFFVQDRFGFNNQVIRVLKFRTMYVDRADVSGAARTVPGDPRVTRVGRFLRSFSLDELPQLINVLQGDMSLVGPRPHAVAMKAGGKLYHDAVAEYAQRHKVKPGITGWAQVNGLRGEIDSAEKARQRVIYDLKYIDDWSLWFDLMILLASLPIVLKRENAY